MTSAIRRRPGADQGFTLVELLVAMVVLGLLAAIAVPAAATQRRKAYETSAKADVQVITREVVALLVDGAGTLTVRSVDGQWQVLDAGEVVTSGPLSPHNTVSPTSFVRPDGRYCLSVTSTKVDARYWTADTVGMRSGTCPPSG